MSQKKDFPVKVTMYHQTLFQLTSLGFVNCYFVREEKSLILIDCGMLTCSNFLILSGS